jgi:hypothetical protein
LRADPAHAVLVHGDAHPSNVLQVPDTTGLFLLRLGHQAEARPFLQAADQLSDTVTPWPKRLGE